MATFHTRLGKSGRIVIPAEARQALGLKEGDSLLVEAQDNRLVLETEAALLQRLYDAVGPRAEGALPSEELIRERHEEAKRERAKPES
jgi:AbrB family looped-hinge helix DNA binding protein